jgi:hypothetical protein
MRIFFTLLIILLASSSLFAQERTISGTLTSTEDGSPLPGVSIYIKGTNIGTATDINGYYSINVPIGSTLVFAFVGMQTREVVVTKDNLQPVKQKANQRAEQRKADKSKTLAAQPIPGSLYKDTITQNVPGVAILTDETPSWNKGEINPSTVRSIRRIGNNYFIRMETDAVKRTGFGLQFSTSIGMEHITQLPALQADYAQGRPFGGQLQWRGADQQEIFSWGPLVRTLEYDGSDYLFDKNGKLVPSGSGNGKNAKMYNPFSFFRTGLNTVNELIVTLPTARNGILVFDVENRIRSGVIPNSDYNKLNLSSTLKRYRLSNSINLNASLSYNRSTGNLLQRGANISNIVGSIYRSPPTFDNTNGLSDNKARSTEES